MTKPSVSTLAPAVGRAVPPAEAPVSLEHVRHLLRGLNREQRRAVTHREGPQLVLAGPGTGKTEVVTRRVAWLIATKRARPREILALTFTDKAAAEMQARVDVLVPYGQADAAIHTFHAFGDRLLREHAFELGLAGDVRLLGRAEQVVLLRENLFSLGLDRYRPLGDPTRFLSALAELFQRAKEEGIEPAQLQAHAAGLAERASTAPEEERAALLDLYASRLELAAAYERYVRLLAERGLIDHGDQVTLALRLLRERPHVRQQVRARYRYVLVDEFQDTNPSQLELVLALTRPRRDVTVVGDDDQAIYTFRGAAAGNMRRFAAAHPDLHRVVLRRNYRSLAPIVAASQRLIGHSGPNRLAAVEGFASEPVIHRRARQPAPVRQLCFPTAETEADGVAREIARRVGAGESPRRFAILVRTNGESDGFVRSLRARGVPVRTSQPANLYDVSAVHALLCFLRVVADPLDSTEFYGLATAPPYGLGGAALTTLLHDARRRHRPLWQVLCDVNDGRDGAPITAAFRRRVERLVADVREAIEMSHERSAGEVLYDHLRRTGRLARLARPDCSAEDAAELAAIARFFEIVRAESRLLAEDRVAFLVPHLATLAEAAEEAADAGPDPDEAASVLTVHRAKGLEFDVVFVCGLVDGRFPARGRPPVLTLPDELCASSGDVVDDPLAEERRLCYVAMTRARDELWLTRPLEPSAGRGARRASIFLAEALDAPSPAAVPSVEQPAERLRTAAERLPGPPAAAPPAPAGSLSMSYSQIDDYLACPERFRLRHVVGVPTPPHHALAYGGALHQAVAAFHLKRAAGHVMTEDELLATFALHWSGEGFLSREHEEARFAAGQDALRLFRSRELATGAALPSGIERRFSFTLGRDTIHGRIDRLDATPEGDVITDYKSSDVREQRRADEKARDSLQLLVYALAREAETGSPPAAVQLHFLDSGVVGRAVPDRRRLDAARDKLTAAADGIRAGSFAARPNPIGCAYCPFRQVCSSSAA